MSNRYHTLNSYTPTCCTFLLVHDTTHVHSVLHLQHTGQWEEMVEKVRRETRYAGAACARSGTRSGGQGGNQVGRCAVVDAAAAVQAVDEAMAKWAALERTAELVMQRGLDRSARSKRVQKSWYAERHEQHMQLMERALPLGLSQQLDALGAGVKSAKGVVVDGKQMVLVEPGAVAAARVLAVGWRATVAAVEMQAEARIEAAWRHHYEEQQSRWEELRGRLQKFKKALDGTESFCRLARKASYAVDAVVKTCEDGVLEYTPLHGASCSLPSALDRASGRESSQIGRRTCEEGVTARRIEAVYQTCPQADQVRRIQVPIAAGSGNLWACVQRQRRARRLLWW